jgi:hypothetical protein
MLDDIFFAVVFFKSLASQGSEKSFLRNALLVAHLVVIVYHSSPLGGVGSRYWQWLPLVVRCRWRPPWGVLPAGPTTTTTEVEEDVDGGPLGALPADPVAATTEVEEDIDGGPPRGRCL